MGEEITIADAKKQAAGAAAQKRQQTSTKGTYYYVPRDDIEKEDNSNQLVVPEVMSRSGMCTRGSKSLKRPRQEEVE